MLAIGRNATALERLAALDSARVVPVTLKPDEPPLTTLKAALGSYEVGQYLRPIRGCAKDGLRAAGVEISSVHRQRDCTCVSFGMS